MHWRTLLPLLAAPVFSLPLSLRDAASNPSHAMWLWTSDLIKDTSSISDFLSVITTPDYGFATVYALIDRDMGIPLWESFVEKCNASGIAVRALMGDPQWILGKTTDDGPTLQHEIDWIKEYQASASTNAKLAGVHLDIEPWGLDGWEANKETYIEALLNIVDTVKSVNLPVAADLPFWANTIACEDTTFDLCMLAQLDSVTFMTYRNTPAGLLEVATPLLEAAAKAGLEKPIQLAVETLADVEDAELISYAGKSVDTLMNDLATVEKSAAEYSQFAGIAVHDYANFVALMA